DREHGDYKNFENLRRVVVDPAVQDWLAADVNPDRAVAFGLDDVRPDLVEDPFVVEPRFEKARGHDRGFVVVRDVRSVHDARILGRCCAAPPHLPRFWGPGHW